MHWRLGAHDISKQMEENQFSIAGGMPGLKVSWQIMGTRQDAWANAHPLIFEKTKTGFERGHHLYPAESGVSASMGIAYAKAKAREKENLVRHIAPVKATYTKWPVLNSLPDLSKFNPRR